MIIPKICPRCGDMRKSIRVANSFLCSICYDEALALEKVKELRAENNELRIECNSLKSFLQPIPGEMDTIDCLKKALASQSQQIGELVGALKEIPQLIFAWGVSRGPVNDLLEAVKKFNEKVLRSVEQSESDKAEGKRRGK